jgi:type VI secretion system secreted protein VgrG
VADVSYSQKNHLLSISTPLGEDVLLLQGLAGQEGLSRLFSYEAELLAPNNPSVDFESIVGQNITMTIQLPDGSPRYINGFVSRFAQGPQDARYFTRYHAQIVPWLWFLTRHSDCRIFQNLAAPDIITQIFNLFSFSDFRNSLTGSYPTLEYCVQYRETAFNFVSRLMEQFGIFYYFDHSTEGRHTLVMRDSNAGLPAVPGSPFNYDVRSGVTDDPGTVSEWHIEEELETGQFSVTDYNFTTPGTSLVASNQTMVSVSPNSGLELFDYPGLHTTKDEGDVVAKLRMQEQESGLKLATGASICRGLMSGYTFVLQNHYRSDQNDTYLLTEVQHVASEGNTYLTGTEEGESYSNHFTCIAISTPYCPARVTRKPFVQGPQPALVVGKKGEEIWVDKYGRVIVQFYWDRLGQKNENSSCWVRVSHPWAGANWGSMWIPRIGQEVLVSFLEGDPDRPIITGRVYNADQMPPYTLPDNQTRSTFMSRSSKGGGSSNYNELRFEDLAGSEQIFMNAERDMDLRVEKESREFVGADRHLIVTENQLEFVKKNKNLHVKGSHLEKVESDMSLQVGGNQMESVTGSKSLSVTGNQNESVTGSVSLQVTMNKDETAMAYALKTDTTIHLNAGVSAVIEAGADLTLKVGANFIDINPGGIFISGTPMVFINSGGAAGSAPDANPQSPDSPTVPEDPDTADDGSKGTKLN